MQNKKKAGATVAQRIATVVGIVLCVVFGFLLICNLTIIIKGSLFPSRPPSVLGTTPMVVLSGSMSGTAKDHIEVGDLIFVGKADPETLQVGDVIAYMQEGSTTVVTHRIMEVLSAQDGTLSFITQGDANNVADQAPVTADRIVGIYQFRIPGVGNFALFLQTPVGMLLFIGVPLLAFVIYDILRRQHYANKEKQDMEALEKELERLRSLAGEKEDS